jgi:hypothetical protein
MKLTLPFLEFMFQEMRLTQDTDKQLPLQVQAQWQQWM